MRTPPSNYHPLLGLSNCADLAWGTAPECSWILWASSGPRQDSSGTASYSMENRYSPTNPDTQRLILNFQVINPNLRHRLPQKDQPPFPLCIFRAERTASIVISTLQASWMRRSSVAQTESSATVSLLDLLRRLVP